MKRELFRNVKALPYTAGDVVDRAGFQSAVLSASVSVAGTLAVAVTHADAADGTFEAVADGSVILYGLGEAKADATVCVGIDLAGCKRFVKLTPSGVTAAYVLILGDHAQNPVEG